MNPADRGEEGEINLKKVYTALIKAQDQWYDLGLQLDMDPNNLKVIENHSYQSNKERLREMLNKRINEKLTWELIADALENPTVDHKTLAEEIRAKYIRPQPAQSAPSRAMSVLSVVSTTEGHSATNTVRTTSNATQRASATTIPSSAARPGPLPPANTPARVSIPPVSFALTKPSLSPSTFPSSSTGLGFSKNLSKITSGQPFPTATPSSSTAPPPTNTVTRTLGASVIPAGAVGGSSLPGAGQTNKQGEPGNPRKRSLDNPKKLSLSRVPKHTSSSASTGRPAGQATNTSASSSSYTLSSSTMGTSLSTAQNKPNTVTGQQTKQGESRKRPLDSSSPATNSKQPKMDDYYDEAIFVSKASLLKYKCIHCGKIPKEFYRCQCGKVDRQDIGKGKPRYDDNTGLSCTKCKHLPCTKCNNSDNYQVDKTASINVRQLKSYCQQCGEKILLFEVDSHSKNKCSKRKKLCKYHWIDCKVEGAGDELDAHENNTSEHFHLAMGTLLDLKKRVESLEREKASSQASTH